MHSEIEAQILKDGLNLGDGVDEATWVFYRSPVTGQIGPSNTVQQALQNAGIITWIR